MSNLKQQLGTRTAPVGPLPVLTPEGTLTPKLEKMRTHQEVEVEGKSSGYRGPHSVEGNVGRGRDIGGFGDSAVAISTPCRQGLLKYGSVLHAQRSCWG